MLLAACGVAAQGAPQIVSRNQVPRGLVGGSPPTTTPVGGPAEYVTIYFSAGQRLVPVTRLIREPVSINKALVALGAGPTNDESDYGLESPISTAAPITVSKTSGTTATVDVSAAFTNLAVQQQELAAAQVVFTVTGFPGVDAVLLRIGGKSAAVPTADGTLGKGPLTRAEYDKLAPL